MFRPDRNFDCFLDDARRSAEIMEHIQGDTFSYGLLCLLERKNSLFRLATGEVMLVSSERDYTFIIAMLRDNYEQFPDIWGWNAWFPHDRAQLDRDMERVETLLLNAGWRFASDEEEKKPTRSILTRPIALWKKVAASIVSSFADCGRC